MLVRLWICMLFPLFIQAQAPEWKEVVVKRHSNGNAEVILYFDIEFDQLVKEHVYYASGKTAWYGHYKNNLEHGAWEFFWENGMPKSKETYLKGKEHGTCYSFDSNGKKIKESVWKNGRLIKETKF